MVVAGIVVNARDVTERRQAENELVRSHDLLEAIIEGTTDTIFVKYVDGRYLMIKRRGSLPAGPGDAGGDRQDRSRSLPGRARGAHHGGRQPRDHVGTPLSRTRCRASGVTAGSRRTSKADLQFARARRAAAAFLGRRPGKFS